MMLKKEFTSTAHEDDTQELHDLASDLLRLDAGGASWSSAILVEKTIASIDAHLRICDPLPVELFVPVVIQCEADKSSLQSLLLVDPPAEAAADTLLDDGDGSEFEAATMTMLLRSLCEKDFPLEVSFMRPSMDSTFCRAPLSNETSAAAPVFTSAYLRSRLESFVTDPPVIPSLREFAQTKGEPVRVGKCRPAAASKAPLGSAFLNKPPAGAHTEGLSTCVQRFLSSDVTLLHSKGSQPMPHIFSSGDDYAPSFLLKTLLLEKVLTCNETEQELKDLTSDLLRADIISLRGGDAFSLRQRPKMPEVQMSPSTLADMVEAFDATAATTTTLSTSRFNARRLEQQASTAMENTFLTWVGPKDERRKKQEGPEVAKSFQTLSRVLSTRCASDDVSFPLYKLDSASQVTCPSAKPPPELSTPPSTAQASAACDTARPVSRQQAFTPQSQAQATPRPTPPLIHTAPGVLPPVPSSPQMPKPPAPTAPTEPVHKPLLKRQRGQDSHCVTTSLDDYMRLISKGNTQEHSCEDPAPPSKKQSATARSTQRPKEVDIKAPPPVEEAAPCNSQQPAQVIVEAPPPVKQPVPSEHPDRPTDESQRSITQLIQACSRGRSAYLQEAGLPPFPIRQLPRTEWQRLISQAQSQCTGESADPGDTRVYVAVVTAWILENAEVHLTDSGVSPQKTLRFVQGVLQDGNFSLVLKDEAPVLEVLNAILDTGGCGAEKQAAAAAAPQVAPQADSEAHGSGSLRYTILVGEEILGRRSLVLELQRKGLQLVDRDSLGSPFINILFDECSSGTILSAEALTQGIVAGTAADFVGGGIQNAHIFVVLSADSPSVEKPTSLFLASLLSHNIRGYVHYCYNDDELASSILVVMDHRRTVGCSPGGAWEGNDVTEFYAQRKWLGALETDHERLISFWPGFNSFSAQICISAMNLSEMLEQPSRLRGLDSYLSPLALTHIQALEAKAAARAPGVGQGA